MIGKIRAISEIVALTTVKFLGLSVGAAAALVAGTMQGVAKGATEAYQQTALAMSKDEDSLEESEQLSDKALDIMNTELKDGDTRNTEV